MKTTKKEALAALSKMQIASNTFYSLAAQTGCHAFIEFTGLMNEYIKICEAMTSTDDFSWMHSNTHTDGSLKMEVYQAHYLAEKLDCIYGPTFRKSRELRVAFEGG